MPLTIQKFRLYIRGAGRTHAGREMRRFYDNGAWSGDLPDGWHDAADEAVLADLRKNIRGGIIGHWGWSVGDLETSP